MYTKLNYIDLGVDLCNLSLIGVEFSVQGQHFLEQV